MLRLLRDINIIISGFMGTGKSSVGRALAQRLSLPFVDIDDLIVARLGMPIPQIFEEYGQSFFRQQESMLAIELSRSTGQVIATGGGTLVSESNYQALSSNGIIFNLTCTPEEILRRLQDNHDRPLLQTADRLSRIGELLQERQPAYAKAHFQIDTTTRSVDQIADEIIAICCVKGYCAHTFTVKFPASAYDIIYGINLTQHIGPILRQNNINGTIAIVTNPIVRRLHCQILRQSLTSAGYTVHIINIPDGEEYKTLQTVRRLYDRFLDLGLDRSSTVIALGGGVVGDIAGFASATFMRGIPYVQVPTTLLAQVDSSIGGKVGIDHPRGKNLIGSFYPPTLVITDPGLLKTLPAEQLRLGLAEIVKAAIIKSPALFESLEQLAPNAIGQLDPIIRNAINIKVDVVNADPLEKDLRAILNFGHTFGHALEAASNFTIPHGEAISIGMAAAARTAAKAALCPTAVIERIINLLCQLGLPTTSAAASPATIMAAIHTDKKRYHGRPRYVLPLHIGEVIVTDDVPSEAVQAALRETFIGPDAPRHAGTTQPHHQ